MTLLNSDLNFRETCKNFCWDKPSLHKSKLLILEFKATIWQRRFTYVRNVMIRSSDQLHCLFVKSKLRKFVYFHALLEKVSSVSCATVRFIFLAFLKYFWLLIFYKLYIFAQWWVISSPKSPTGYFSYLKLQDFLKSVKEKKLCKNSY